MVWLSIIIVHEKICFFASFFQNISKTTDTLLIKKIEQDHAVLVYKKAQINLRKNYIFPDINNFVKMSFSSTLPIFVYVLVQKLV